MKPNRRCIRWKLQCRRRDALDPPLIGLTDTTDKDFDDWTTIEFLHAKQQLKFAWAVEVARLCGKKGMVAILKKSLETATQKGADLTDLPPTDILMLKLEKQLGVAIESDENTVTCKRSNYMDRKEKLTAAKDHTDILEEEFMEHSQALDFKSTSAGKDNRKQFAKNYWQGSRAQSHFQRGNYCDGGLKVPCQIRR